MLNPSIPQDRRMALRTAHERSERVTATERVLPVLSQEVVLRAAVFTGLVLLMTLLASRPAR